MRVLKHYGFTR